MGRRWKFAAAVVGAAALAGVGLGGCNRGGGILDPGGPVTLPDGGFSDEGDADGRDGGAATADGRATTTADAISGGGGGKPGDAGAPTDARPTTDAGTAADARPTTDAGDGGPMTQSPTSACALSAGRRPAAPANPANVIVDCGGTLYVSDSMSRAPAAPGQSYTRCATLGPETSWRATLSPDGRRLAARTSAGTVRLYRTDAWLEIAQLAAPVGALDAIAFSPDGARLAAVSGETGQVTLWNAADGTLAASFEGPPLDTVGYPSSALAFSSDGRRLATSLGTIIDVPTGAMTTFDGRPAGPYAARTNPAGTPDRQSSSTSALRFVGCDQRLLVDAASPGGMSGWVRYLSLVDPVSGASKQLAGGLWAEIGNVVASADSRWVAFVQHGDNEIGVHLYDAAVATRIAFDPTPAAFVAGFSPSGDRLYVITDKAIQVREIPSYRLLRQSPLPTAMPTPTAAAISPFGGVILSTDSESVWLDPATDTVHRHELFPIADPSFSADGLYGVTDGNGATLYHLWRETDTSGACSPAAAAPERAIAGMALSQDGNTLAVVDVTGIVQLRAVGSGLDVRSATTTVVTSVARGPLDTALAVANGGERVAVLGNPPPAPGMPAPGEIQRLVVADAADGRPLLARDVSLSGGRLALSPDGAWVAFQDGNYPDGTLLAVLVDTGATALSFSTNAGYRVDSFSPDSKRLAVTTGNAIEIWEIATGNFVTTYALDGSYLGDPGLSPDWSLMGGIVSTIPPMFDQDATVVWHPADGSVVARIDGYMTLEAPLLFDGSGKIFGIFAHATHTFSTDWDAWQVRSLADGSVLRFFPTTADYREPLLALPGGGRVLTRAGTALAVWCR